jgi:hypothetical protein
MGLKILQEQRAQILFCLAIIITTLGCQPAAHQKLLGRWNVNLETEDIELGEMTIGENPLLANLGQTLLNALNVELEMLFRADETFSMTLEVMGNALRREGTWRVLESNDETIVVETRLGEDSEAKTWKIRFLSEDEFQTVPPQGSRLKINRLVTFRRTRPSST